MATGQGRGQTRASGTRQRTTQTRTTTTTTQAGGSNPPQGCGGDGHPDGVNKVVDLLAEAEQNYRVGVGYTVVAGNHLTTAEEQTGRVASALQSAQAMIARTQVQSHFPPAQPTPEPAPPAPAPQRQVAEVEEDEGPMLPWWGWAIIGGIVGLIVGLIVLGIVHSSAHGNLDFVHDAWFNWLLVLLFIALGALVAWRAAHRSNARRVRRIRRERELREQQGVHITMVNGQPYLVPED